MTDVKGSIESAVRYLSEHPEEARYTDSLATATLGEGLRVQVEGPKGERLTTDMPKGVGGAGEAPTPGWLYRASLASCVATTIGMEAAREGVTLGSLVVEADSESDDRGLLGMDDTVPPGALSVRIRISGRAEGVDPERLRTLLERGALRCPVCDSTKRAVPVTLEIHTGD